MNIKSFSILLALTANCAILAQADQYWDFSDGTTQGWQLSYQKWEDLDESKWEQYGIPVDTAENATIMTGFQVATGDDVEFENNLGSLVGSGMMTLPVSGDLSSYIGGSLNFTYTDYHQKPQWGGEYPPTTEGYIYMTGMLNGEAVILRHLLSYDFENPAQHNFTLSLQADQFDRVALVHYFDDGLTPVYNTVNLGGLSDADFMEFMGNCSGIYFRAISDTPTYVDPGAADWVTRIYGASLKQKVIPETSTSVLGLFSLTGMLMRRRKQ